ncbi:DUF4176 domain-containing protein [uncultured Vagococcus sp.]|uniref:DUF4176 domain-containing protein n=1 Tax=uncultured Vagococcus sp. TaxID=189676 RepID=UPI0028D8D08B|nr:DUF4176 domain-containing protein [uncultured Vagococcus sp.]
MLAIGSIVYLNEGSKKIMILNRGPLVVIENQKTMFDYSGCIYPLGLVSDEILYFNEENIDKAIFNGFSDEEETRFEEIYREWLVKNEKKVVKGIVPHQL